MCCGGSNARTRPTACASLIGTRSSPPTRASRVAASSHRRRPSAVANSGKTSSRVASTSVWSSTRSFTVPGPPSGCGSGLKRNHAQNSDGHDRKDDEQHDHREERRLGRVGEVADAATGRIEQHLDETKNAQPDQRRPHVTVPRPTAAPGMKRSGSIANTAFSKSRHDDGHGRCLEQRVGECVGVAAAAQDGEHDPGQRARRRATMPAAAASALPSTSRRPRG